VDEMKKLVDLGRQMEWQPEISMQAASEWLRVRDREDTCSRWWQTRHREDLKSGGDGRTSC
jgi:hypothetical protein